jgi:hypothetical protein
MTLEMVSYLFYSINTFTGYIAKNATVIEDEADFIAWRKSKNFSYMDIFDKIAPTCEDMFVVNATLFCETPGYFTISPIDTFEYGRRCVQLTANSTLMYSNTVGEFLLHTRCWGCVNVKDLKVQAMPIIHLKLVLRHGHLGFRQNSQ